MEPAQISVAVETSYDPEINGYMRRLVGRVPGVTVIYVPWADPSDDPVVEARNLVTAMRALADALGKAPQIADAAAENPSSNLLV